MFKKLLGSFFVLALCFTSSLSFADITSNLQLHYTFDDNTSTGTRLNDDSGNLRFLANLNNTDPIYSGSLTGSLGDAMYCRPGSEMTSNPLLQLSGGTFTFATWIKGGGTINGYTAWGRRTNNRYGLATYSDRLRVNDSSTVPPAVLNTTLSSDTWFHYAVTYDSSVAGGTIKIYVNGSIVGSGTSRTPLFLTNTLYLCSQPKFSSPYYEPYPSNDGAGYDEIRYYNRALSDADIIQLYGYAPTPAVVDGICGYSLGFTGSFSTGSACLQGIFTGLSTFDLNGYTGYSYTCAYIGSGTSASCVTAEQTTGACGTLQGLTIYGDIQDRFDKNYCSGGANGTTDFMTGLQFNGVDYDWYCNGPTEFGPQAYCSAFVYNTTTPLCGPANLQTFATGTSLTGSYICTSGEPGFFQFRENYGRIWECQIDSGVLPAVDCVAYLSGGLGYIVPTYTGDNPFEYAQIMLSGDELVSTEAKYFIGLLKTYIPFFGTYWDIFSTYVSFVPQSSELSLQFPWVGTDGTLGIDSVVFSGLQMSDYFAYWGCDEGEVYCYYTTHLGVQHKILMNPFRQFLVLFLPVFFGLLYVSIVIIMIMFFIFLPVYFLIPIFTQTANYFFSTSYFANNNYGNSFKGMWLLFAIPFFTLCVSLSVGYLDLMAPFFDQIKGALGYFLSFILVNFLYTPADLMRQTVITINFIFFTLLGLYLVYIFTKFFDIKLGKFSN